MKTHWGDVKRDITKFNGAYARAMSARSSEQSDDMVLKAAHEMFKGGNKGKSFIYEYLWKVAKDMPKWGRIIQEESTPKGPSYPTQERTLLHPTKTQRGPTAIDGLVQIHCGLKLNYYHLLWDSHLWTGSPIYIALALSRFFLGSRMGP